MGTNTAAPNGLTFSRLRFGSPNVGAPNNFALIKNGYATNIGIGDLVITLTGASQGFIGISTGVEIAQLGVFVGITSPPMGTFGVAGANGDGVYDTNLQGLNYGRNGAYVSTITPATGINIGARIISSPDALFRAQMIGGAWTDSMRGQNINFTAGTNGSPNAAGTSILSLDYSTIGLGNQLPFRIEGLSGVQGGPQDPTNTNPWIEVSLNTTEQMQGAGI